MIELLDDEMIFTIQKLFLSIKTMINGINNMGSLYALYSHNFRSLGLADFSMTVLQGGLELNEVLNKEIRNVMGSIAGDLASTFMEEAVIVDFKEEAMKAYNEEVERMNEVSQNLEMLRPDEPNLRKELLELKALINHVTIEQEIKHSEGNIRVETLIVERCLECEKRAEEIAQATKRVNTMTSIQNKSRSHAEGRNLPTHTTQIYKPKSIKDSSTMYICAESHIIDSNFRYLNCISSPEDRVIEKQKFPMYKQGRDGFRTCEVKLHRPK